MPRTLSLSLHTTLPSSTPVVPPPGGFPESCCPSCCSTLFTSFTEHVVAYNYPLIVWHLPPSSDCQNDKVRSYLCCAPCHVLIPNAQ